MRYTERQLKFLERNRDKLSDEDTPLEDLIFLTQDLPNYYEASAIRILIVLIREGTGAFRFDIRRTRKMGVDGFRAFINRSDYKPAAEPIMANYFKYNMQVIGIGLNSDGTQRVSEPYPMKNFKVASDIDAWARDNDYLVVVRADDKENLEKALRVIDGKYHWGIQLKMMKSDNGTFQDEGSLMVDIENRAGLGQPAIDIIKALLKERFEDLFGPEPEFPKEVVRLRDYLYSQIEKDPKVIAP